jgi:hypothetical protein
MSCLSIYLPIYYELCSDPCFAARASLCSCFFCEKTTPMFFFVLVFSCLGLSRERHCRLTHWSDPPQKSTSKEPPFIAARLSLGVTEKRSSKRSTRGPMSENPGGGARGSARAAGHGSSGPPASTSCKLPWPRISISVLTTGQRRHAQSFKAACRVRPAR